MTYRLGIKKKDRPRPLKIHMKSTDQKEQLLSNLWKLKFAQPDFKNISVTEDYTIEEREEIRRWVKMAKDKNEIEKVTTWKVRGTPKIGMRLVKISIQYTTDEARALHRGPLGPAKLYS